MTKHLRGSTFLLLFCLLFGASKAHSQDTLPMFDGDKAKFEVTNISAITYGDSPNVIENPENVRYLSPLFVANATVKCNIPYGESYTIGFIQQIDSLDIRAEYPRAFLTWETPNLPANDSDGKEFPWISNTVERQSVRGNGTDIEVEVNTNDTPAGNFSWYELLPPFGKQRREERELQRITRNQKFTTWLVAKRDSDGAVETLSKIVWYVALDISTDLSKPLGLKCKINIVPVPATVIVSNPRKDDPSMRILQQVMLQPTSNTIQQFWWTPKKKDIGDRIRLW